MNPATAPPNDRHDFIGRDAEIRRLLANAAAGHASLVIGEDGVGKSALLRVVAANLAGRRPVVSVARVTPFGSFLRALFGGLWAHGLIPDQGNDRAADEKAWARAHPNNDAKARALLELLAHHARHRPRNRQVVIVLDDVTGVTPTSLPWLEQLVELGPVLAAATPKALQKRGTKRFWKRFAEVRLAPLSRGEARRLLERLVARYRVQADDPAVYARTVLQLAQGNPFELDRLVRHHAGAGLVRTRELGGYGQAFVERDEHGVSLAPLLLAAGAGGIALRYVARAQGDLDLYVLGGLSVAGFFLAGPLIRRALRPRSN